MTKNQWLHFTLLVAAVYLLLDPLWFAGQSSLFQCRDISRAQAVASGQLAFFGPETSGGGFLPGGFYYELIAPPLWLGLGWLGIWREMLLLFSVGIGVLYIDLKRRFGFSTALLAVALCLSSFNLMSVLHYFMNPSFLPLFVVLIMLCLLETFTTLNQTRAKWTWFAAWFLMALGMQLHFTAAFLVLSALLLQGFAPELGLKRKSKKQLILGLFVFFILLLPNFIWLYFRTKGHPFGIEAVNESGDSLYATQFIFDQFVFKLMELEFLPFLRRLLQTFFIPEVAVGVLTTYVALRFHGRTFVPHEEPSDLSSSIRVLAVISACSALPCFYYLVTPAPSRYTVVFAICFPVFLALLCKRLWARCPSLTIKTWWILALILITTICQYWEIGEILPSSILFLQVKYLLVISAFTAISILISRSFSFKTSLYSIVLASIAVAMIALRIALATHVLAKVTNRPSFTEWLDADQFIKSTVNWDYSRVRRHLFYVNVDSETTLQMIHEFSPARSAAENPNVDGFFVGLLLPPEAAQDHLNPMTWLANHQIERSLLDSLQHGEILLMPHFRRGRMMVVPYRQALSFRKADWLQNQGTPYLNVSLEDFSNPSAPGHYGRIHDCPQPTKLCDIVIQVQRSQDSDGQSLLRVFLFGNPIASPSDWVNPEWVQTLIHSQLELTCNSNTETVALPIANSIGFHYNGPKMMISHTLLAPFQKTFLDPCPGQKIDHVSFSYHRSEVSSHNHFFDFPGKQILLTESGDRQ